MEKIKIKTEHLSPIMPIRVDASTDGKQVCPVHLIMATDNTEIQSIYGQINTFKKAQTLEK